MDYLTLMVVFIATCTVQAAETDREWNYTDREAWKYVEEWSCDGMRQSPININTTGLKKDSKLIDLVLNNFDRSFNGKLNNTGHTVQFIPDGDSETATFANHVGTYNLKQFHFHWGRSTMQLGSEHAIDGNKFSGEMHFVTRKNTGNETAGDAFAVLGVFVIEDSSVPYNNTIWMEFLNKIPHKAAELENVSGVVLSDFLPDDRSYYYYEGSLTTPPCSQVVQWFLLRNPIRIPSIFMNALRTMVNNAEEETLTMNFRDTQQLNNRDVMIQDTDGGGGSGSGLTSFGTTLLTVVALLVYGSNY